MSKPIDFDNKEFILYQRQKLIVKKLLKVSVSINVSQWKKTNSCVCTLILP